jgi:hypothetical protein
MKKLIALALAALLAASMISCGGASDEPKDTTADTTVVTEEVIEANTVATKLQVAFREAAKANAAATAEELAGVCAQNEAVALIGPMVAPIAEGWLNGFDAESITGFAEGAVFAPMIGTIPFMGYIFTLAEDADVEAFKTQLTSTADLRWNICTAADEMVCDDEGNKVFFVMAPKAIEE